MDEKAELIAEIKKFFSSLDDKLNNPNYEWTPKDEEILNEMCEISMQIDYWYKGWTARKEWEVKETWLCVCGVDNFDRLTCQFCGHKKS